jgi:hypothetical protein
MAMNHRRPPPKSLTVDRWPLTARERNTPRILVPLLGEKACPERSRRGSEAGEVLDARGALLIERAQRLVPSPLRRLSSKERRVFTPAAFRSGRQRSTLNRQRAQHSP